MHRFAIKIAAFVVLATGGAVAGGGLKIDAGPATQATGAARRIDLAAELSGGRINAVNREVTPLQGTPGGVHLDARPGNGVAWIDGTDFATGTIELEIRGKDVMQQSFVGVAFHRSDDNGYEAVYLRPFNFRAEDPARKQRAIQYIALPDYDWPRLRKEFPEEFENPVDASLSPTDWVPVRVVVSAKAIQIFAGAVKSPTLEVRKLGSHERGMVGLWAGNGSDGDFRNLRLTPAR